MKFISRGLVTVFLLATWCVGAPSGLGAQTLRADAIAREQQAKAESLSVEGPGAIEKVIVWVAESPLMGRGSGPYPWADAIYPGAGTGVGAGYVQRWSRKAQVSLAAGVGLSGSAFFQGGAQLPEFDRGRVVVSLNGRHTIAKEQSFFGLGQETLRRDSLLYHYRPTAFGSNVSFRPNQWFELSAQPGFMVLRSEYDVQPPPGGGEPGLGERLEYGVLQASATVDLRTPSGYFRRGGSHRVTVAQFLETQGRPFGFHKFEYEGTQLIPILREQWILAFRVLTTLTAASAGDSVPVVLMPTLGGNTTLRAFETRRFTDLNRLLFTGEYRWRPSRSMDMAFFVDAGSVAAQRSDLKPSNMEVGWGFGLRVHGPTTPLFRAEAAKGREGWAVFLAGGTAF